jgi:regulator of protease activity HflC (stomatin/prohibitin superfamily)
MQDEISSIWIFLDLDQSISIFLVIILAAGLMIIKIFKEYERGVVFRLGRLVAFRGPGLVVPFTEKKRWCGLICGR